MVQDYWHILVCFLVFLIGSLVVVDGKKPRLAQNATLATVTFLKKLQNFLGSAWIATVATVATVQIVALDMERLERKNIQM